MKYLITLLIFGITISGLAQRDTSDKKFKSDFGTEKYYASLGTSFFEPYLSFNYCNKRHYLFSAGYNSYRINPYKSRNGSVKNPPIQYIQNYTLFAGKRMKILKFFAFSLQAGISFVHLNKPINIKSTSKTSGGGGLLGGWPTYNTTTFIFERKHYYLPGFNIKGNFQINFSKSFSTDLGFAFCADKFNQELFMTFGISFGKVR